MTAGIQIYKGQEPTKEQRQEIREAAKRTPVYDEDAPELSLEQMRRYRKPAGRDSLPVLKWDFHQKSAGYQYAWSMESKNRA